MKYQIVEVDGRYCPQYKRFLWWFNCVDGSAGIGKVLSFEHYHEAEEYLLNNDAENIGVEVSVIAGGLPTFYLGTDGKVSTKRLADTDIPLWAGSSGDGWDAMKRINQMRQQLADQANNAGMLAELADFLHLHKVVRSGMNVVQAITRHAWLLSAQVVRSRAHLCVASEHLQLAGDPYGKTLERVISQTPGQSLAERDIAMQIIGIEKLVDTMASGRSLHASFEMTADQAYDYCDELWGDDSQHVRGQYDPHSSAARRGAIQQLRKA